MGITTGEYYVTITAAGTGITHEIKLTYTVLARGDCNRDGVVDVGDLIYLINYGFKGGPAPIPIPSGDADCSGQVNIGDIVFLINYLFKLGPAPGC